MAKTNIGLLSGCSEAQADQIIYEMALIIYGKWPTDKPLPVEFIKGNLNELLRKLKSPTVEDVSKIDLTVGNARMKIRRQAIESGVSLSATNVDPKILELLIPQQAVDFAELYNQDFGDTGLALSIQPLHAAVKTLMGNLSGTIAKVASGEIK